MAEVFYSKCVGRKLRLYARQENMNSDDKKICNKVINTYPKTVQAIILDIYGSYDTFSDNVYNASKKYNYEQDVIWKIVADLEKQIAKEKGCI